MVLKGTDVLRFVSESGEGVNPGDISDLRALFLLCLALVTCGVQ